MAPPPKKNDSLIGCGIIIVAALIAYPFIGLIFGKSDAEKATDLAKVESEKISGFHCLSQWDGSHRELISNLKTTLRDPDSFEHIDTKITPVDAKGFHLLTMRYRSKNGFGGMAIGTVIAQIKKDNCSFEMIMSTSE